MSKYLFVVLAGHKYGFGHLKRCILIAKKLRTKSIDFLIIGKNKETKAVLNNNGFYSIFGLRTNERLDSERNKNFIFKYNKIIFDISNKSNINFNVLANFKFYLNKKKSNKIILIDSKYSESIICKNDKLPIDLIFIPYFTENKFNNIKKIKSYIGEKYSVINEIYAKKKKRKLNRNVKKIFITFGGSDPKNISMKVLKSLKKISREFQIKLSIGPYFKHKQTLSLKRYAKLNNLNLKFLINTDLLHDYFIWSDMSIIGSGLTKYEMLATGTPGISISLNKSDHKSNKLVSKKNAIISLPDNVSIKELSRKISKTANNFTLRTKLSSKSKDLVDGRGLHRVLNAIEKLG